MYPFILEHPEIAHIERTGYPSWINDDDRDRDEDGDDDDCRDDDDLEDYYGD